MEVCIYVCVCVYGFRHPRDGVAVQHTDLEFGNLKGLRPFGVSLLYAGYDPHYNFQLYHSDPSGNYSGWKATCIGANSGTAQSLLKQEYKDDIGIEEAVGLVLRVMSKTMDSTTLGSEKREWSRCRPHDEHIDGRRHSGVRHAESRRPAAAQGENLSACRNRRAAEEARSREERRGQRDEVLRSLVGVCMRAYMHVCRFPRGSTPPLVSHRTLELNPATIILVCLRPIVIHPCMYLYLIRPCIQGFHHCLQPVETLGSAASTLVSYLFIHFILSILSSRPNGKVTILVHRWDEPPVDVTFRFGKEFKGRSEVTENRTTPLVLTVILPSTATLVYAPSHCSQRVRQVFGISTARSVRTLRSLTVSGSTVI